MTTGSVLDAAWNVDASTSDKVRLYALVDHAGCPGLMSRLAQSRHLEWANLFEGSTEVNALDVAPLLIDLGAVRNPNEGGPRMCAWLAHACSQSNALVIMRSTYTLASLARALASRLDACVPDDIPVMLRYFDTRVFASLLEVLDVEQRRAFTAIAHKWWWLDRRGGASTLNAVEESTDPLKSPIQLDQRQQDLLVRNSEADAVMVEVVRTAPDLCTNRSRAELHQLVNECLPRAAEFGIKALPMQALFCIVAMERGPAFFEQPAWADKLKDGQQRKHNFAWVVQQVEEVSST